MSISEINNYNYPNYYAGARHNMAKTGGRDSGVLSSTSSASSNITLHMSPVCQAQDKKIYNFF